MRVDVCADMCVRVRPGASCLMPAGDRVSARARARACKPACQLLGILSEMPAAGYSAHAIVCTRAVMCEFVSPSRSLVRP